MQHPRTACNDIALGKRACPELLGEVKIEPITAHGQYETPLYGERLGPEEPVLPIFFGGQTGVRGKVVGMNYRLNADTVGNQDLVGVAASCQFDLHVERPRVPTFSLRRSDLSEHMVPCSSCRIAVACWTRSCSARLSAMEPFRLPPVQACEDKPVATYRTGSGLADGQVMPGGARWCQVVPGIPTGLQLGWWV